MTVEILNWRPVRRDSSAIASFNFRTRDITVRAAMFISRENGYTIAMPFSRHTDKHGSPVTAVGMTHDLRQAVLDAAVAYHEAHPDDDVDCGRHSRDYVAETMWQAGL